MTTLSAIQIAQLTAIVTGGGFKRAATKDAAIKRFLAVTAEKGISGDAANAILLADDPAIALTFALGINKPAELTKTSPGLARLRASQEAEAIRQSANEEADAARSAVLAGMPATVLVVGSEAMAMLGGKARKSALNLGKEPEVAPAKAAKPKAPKPVSASSRTRMDTAATITAVVENPKKSGSRSHARFALYAVGQTVQGFIDACVEAGFPEAEAKADLSWDRRKGFITVGDAAAEAA